MFPKKLLQKLEYRKANNALRYLGKDLNLIDFSSNDYLGFSQSEVIFNNTHQYLQANNISKNGATGSRLISGNHSLYSVVENQLCDFHNSESALIFNSGYDTNIGFFSSVPQRGDVILYDEFIHASIRDGISMSHAKAYKFKHNDVIDLDRKCYYEQSRIAKENNIYVVTESVFSMDGDTPDLLKMTQICKAYHALFVVDEAHAVGVFGEKGDGLIQNLKLEKEVFARIITFGKAIGCHGAAILGSSLLIQYLVNFSRSFIYTTGLSPHSLATIQSAYHQLIKQNEIEASVTKKLHKNIYYFKYVIKEKGLDAIFIKSNSAIQCCIISGNEKVKQIARNLKELGFNVKPILSPTVPINKERLRFCLHNYNSEQEIARVLNILDKLLKE